MVACALAVPDDEHRRATLMRGFTAIYLKHLRTHGCVLPDHKIAELLALDIELNAQGIAVWLNRRKRQQSNRSTA
jgi:hypothetical protein